jgi:CheY-like chemotaxis protein
LNSQPAFVGEGVAEYMVPSSDLPHSSPLAGARQCILVVEDEVLIRLMVSEMLRDAGYEVIEACDADEALAVLESAVRVDLIFSDVRMPGSLDGLGLLSVVKATSPALPVIIASAHLEPDGGLAAGASQVLLKPYLLNEVVALVRSELAKAA